MAQEVRGWGRIISLPPQAESRYWLRAQADPARYSTVESLLVLLDAFHLRDAARILRLQFELHVYASLRARGQKRAALEFLTSSPIRAEFPELLEAFEISRPQPPFGTPPARIPPPS